MSPTWQGEVQVTLAMFSLFSQTRHSTYLLYIWHWGDIIKCHKLLPQKAPCEDNWERTSRIIIAVNQKKHFSVKYRICNFESQTERAYGRLTIPGSFSLWKWDLTHRMSKIGRALSLSGPACHSPDIGKCTSPHSHKLTGPTTAETWALHKAVLVVTVERLTWLTI